MTIQQYLTKVETLYKSANVKEKSYQCDLQFLILSILYHIIEAKNEESFNTIFSFELGSKKLKELFERYKLGLSNLVLDTPIFKNEEIRDTNTPNLNAEIVKEISIKLEMFFINERESNVCFANSDELRPEYKIHFTPTELLNYIYAVLFSSNFWKKFIATTKIDFPKIPYPKDLTTFVKLSNLGGELRQIHLLESATVENYITQYPEDGDNVVGKVIARKNDEAISTNDKIASCLAMTVFINDTQYFANVPEVAWNFYIGGYQPAQKWLKDHKGRELSYEDILHYQKIIVALTETDRIMKEIDTIEI